MLTAGESWAARCAAAWKMHGLSLAAQAPAAHPQPRPSAAQQSAAGTTVSPGVAAGDELGVRLDRRQFAAARAAVPQLHAVRVRSAEAALTQHLRRQGCCNLFPGPRFNGTAMCTQNVTSVYGVMPAIQTLLISSQDVLPAPEEVAAQPIRFDRAAAPLGLGSAPAGGAAATAAAPVANTAAAMEWAFQATAIPGTQAAEAAASLQAADRSGGVSQPAAHQLKRPPEAVAAMLALQQPPQPQRRPLPQPLAAAAQQPAAPSSQHAAPLTAEQPPQDGLAGPQPVASVAAAPAPPLGMTASGSVPRQPHTIAPPPAAMPASASAISRLGIAAGGSWGSSWAAAPGLGSEPAAPPPAGQQPSPAAPAAAPLATQLPAGAEVHGSSAPEGAATTAGDTAAPMQVDAVPHPAAEPQHPKQQDAKGTLLQPSARRTLLQPQRKKRRAAAAAAAAPSGEPACPLGCDCAGSSAWRHDRGLVTLSHPSRPRCRCCSLCVVSFARCHDRGLATLSHPSRFRCQCCSFSACSGSRAVQLG